MTNKMIMITTAPAWMIASNSSIMSSSLSSTSTAVTLAEGVSVTLGNIDVAITVSVGTTAVVVTVGVAVVTRTSCVDDT